MFVTLNVVWSLVKKSEKTYLINNDPSPITASICTKFYTERASMSSSLNVLSYKVVGELI